MTPTSTPPPVPTPSPTPTGRLDDQDTSWVVLTRTFQAPVEHVWAAVTESDRLARWIGTWTGDPASGQVQFTMTAEGDDVRPLPYDIAECRPPRLLRVSSVYEGALWELRLQLAESDGVTTLHFAQRLADPDLAASIGPGWEYYLDRLVAAESGAEVIAIDFGDYYPALSDHYRSLLSPASAPGVSTESSARA